MARKAASSTTSAIDAGTRVLVLHGPEAFVQQQHLEALREALRQKHREVQTIHFEGETCALSDVLDELRSFGLMADYKIVVVEGSEKFVTSHRPALERYAAAPVDHATLVLKAETWRPGNLDKAIAKVGCVLKCEAPTGARLLQWVTQRAAAAHSRTLTPPAAQLLVQRVGAHLMALDNELAKLALLVEPQASIDEALVGELVGRASDEKAWAVQEPMLKALLAPFTGVPQALGSLHELVNLADESDIAVSYFVADLFRKLDLAARMKQQGINDFQIGRELKLWGDRQTLFMQALKAHRSSATARWFDRVIACDRGAKSGWGEPMRNLECFCALLTDEKS